MLPLPQAMLQCIGPGHHRLGHQGLLGKIRRHLPQHHTHQIILQRHGLRVAVSQNHRQGQRLIAILPALPVFPIGLHLLPYF